MNVFVQGMRRSGTTILYDLLSEDPGFAAFYEPLGVDKVAVGGGSGVRAHDLFTSTRRARAAFVREHPEVEDGSLLNVGAPRDPRLELESDAPSYVRDYLRFLVAQADDVVLKFTRAYRKIAVLAEVDRQALLVHVVRDPRAVTASYLFGPRHARRDSIEEPDAFFAASSDYSAWASHPLSSHLLTLPEYRDLGPCSDVERILLLWRYTFEETRRAGLRHYADRYLLVRHEDLQADPRAVMSELYARIGRPLPAAVARFACAVVRPAAPPFAAGDPRWRRAQERLGLLPALRDAGYETLPCKQATPPADDAARIRGLEERIGAEMGELSRRGPGRRSRVPESVRFLFVCGCPRSGTTALATFLNGDDRVLLGQERYRRIIPLLEPFHFSEPLFFNPTLTETSWAMPWRKEPVFPGSFADYQLLRERWRRGDVQVLGDKAPHYHRHLDRLAERFPAARFVLLLRDLRGVARSYVGRAENPVDHWPAENDHRLAVEHWNEALASARQFLAGPHADRLLLVSYAKFFGGAAGQLERLYAFLELELSVAEAERYARLGAEFQRRRGADKPLAPAVEAHLAAHGAMGLEAEVRALAAR